MAMMRFCLLFLVLLVFGCQQGPPLGEVSGTVKFESEPIENATVMFTHAEGRAAFARTDANGFYELNFSDGRAGALLGENAISIETGRVGSDAEGNIVEYPEILPAKYNVESEITRTIEPGAQILDFDLTKD
jgi:hypothetical protein